MSKYLMGIDIGTQGTKIILFDKQMKIIAEGFEASNLISPKPGTVWQDPQEIIDSVTRVISATLKQYSIDGAEIASIGVDGQMAGIMGVKADGTAATVYDSWLDTRCGKYLKIMVEKAGKRVTQITGGPVTYTHGPKILWWKHEHPEIYKDIHKFVLPHAYVVMQMCGLNGDSAYFDYTCLQYSGFGDNLNKVWSDELLSTFDVDKNKMAKIVSPFDIVGNISTSFASKTGLKQGIPVVAGLGDTAASTFGSGMVEKGMIQDCAGTASVFCSLVDEYKADTEFETMTQVRSPIDGLWLPLSYINGGGLCIRWFRDNFTGNPPASYNDLQAEASEISAGSEGVLFVPHFSGRVLPHNPYVKGSFIGLDWKHNRAHTYRAMMEGIAYEYAHYFSVMKQLFPHQDFKCIYTSGGGAKSTLFNQIKADVLGIPVTTFTMGETALAGAAVIAGVASGMLDGYKKPLENIMSEGTTYMPSEQNHTSYQKYAKEYLSVIKALEPIYKSEVYGIE